MGCLDAEKQNAYKNVEKLKTKKEKLVMELDKLKSRLNECKKSKIEIETNFNTMHDELKKLKDVVQNELKRK